MCYTSAKQARDGRAHREKDGVTEMARLEGVKEGAAKSEKTVIVVDTSLLQVFSSALYAVSETPYVYDKKEALDFLLNTFSDETLDKSKYELRFDKELLREIGIPETLFRYYGL